MKTRLAAGSMIATALAFSSSAAAFEVKHAPGGALVRWQRTAVTWTVDSSVDELEGGAAAITAALETWSQRSGAPLLALALATDEPPLEPGLDGKSGVFYAPAGFAPAVNSLAVTVLSFDEATGEVLDADVVLNGTYRLGPVDEHALAPTSADHPGAQTYDIGRVVAHEMGHALGLSDELTHDDALMYPYVPRARALPREPAPDDLLGLETLYVRGASPVGTDAGDAAAAAGCAVAHAGARPAPGAAFAAAAIVVGALATARRTRRGRSGAARCTVIAEGSPAVVE